MILFNLSASSQILQWAKSFGGTAWEIGYSLALDGSGNVYITGEFDGTVDFDPGAGTFNLNSAGDRDIFILKLGLYNAGINEALNKNLFSVFPNPATNQINIIADISLLGSMYSISDPMGKIVLSA